MTHQSEKLNVVVISDTHNNPPPISEVPDGDILIHCGDFTNQGDPRMILQFRQWMEMLPHKYKIVIAGNHEQILDDSYAEAWNLQFKEWLGDEIIYLQDEGVIIEGFNFWGTPWTRFTTNDPAKFWRKIPTETDILITHEPPHNILDLAWEPADSTFKKCKVCDQTHPDYQHWGTESLRDEVLNRVKPMVHCFGHVHDVTGFMKIDDTLFINAAYDIKQKIYQFQLNKHLSTTG